eukprot:CAMPEP_0173120340 /NCGR_PEP_ID=MMETSP1102-20130122/52463_1 /TAXON_ID=49646 /ORGANISM="Geminigera sp., Strain Caron Lab Isolate" /LENGTH=40 /DNA_ID= /DNA_START= /DNA_END= /DNA_ORIENTATION=
MTGSVMTSIVMGHMYSGGTVTPKSSNMIRTLTSSSSSPFT